MRRRLPVLVAVLLAGCALRGVPTFSLAKYARANAGEQVRLVGAVGGGYARETEPDSPTDPEDELLGVPLVEVGGAYRLHELYGVSVSATNGMLAVEGQLRFGDQRFAIGILHGAGIGAYAAGDDPIAQINLIGGLFAQIGLDPQHYLLLGARYVFDDLHGNTPSSGGMPPENGMHWLDFGVGWLGQIFNLFGIGFELHSGVNLRVAGDQPIWFILPTLTVQAAF